MAKAEEQIEQPPVQGAETPSMEEILQSIRGVISGDDAAAQDESDVLELVEIVEEGNIANTLISGVDPAIAPIDDTNPEKSILDDIDEALEKDVATPISENTTMPETVKVEEAIIPEAAPVENTPPVSLSAQQEPVEENNVQTLPAENDMNDSETDSPIKIENNETDADLDLEEIENAKNHSKSLRLLGEKAAKQSSGSIKELVSSIHDKHVDSPYTRHGTSLEDLVIEAMKPFLAEWLNKNLPVIVRKIVEKEVKRLIPKEEDDY